MTSFANLLFDQIHHFAKNIHNINDGHLAQIIQLKCAHTWYIPIDPHLYSGTSTDARVHTHTHTPNNETFGLGNEETTDTVKEMDMAHTYFVVTNARRNVAVRWWDLGSPRGC
jgi:hypothetical protein